VKPMSLTHKLERLGLCRWTLTCFVDERRASSLEGPNRRRLAELGRGWDEFEAIPAGPRAPEPERVKVVYFAERHVNKTELKLGEPAGTPARSPGDPYLVRPGK